MCWTTRPDGPPGGAARWWLAQSLRALGADVAARGGSLVLRKGPAAKVIPEVARESGASAVYWNTIAQAPHQAVEKQLEAALAKLGVDTQSFPGDLLVPPSAIRNKEGRGLRVFTPFWRRVLSLGDPPKPLPAPKELRPRAEDRRAIGWRAGSSSRRRPDWAGGLRESWTPGEASARARLRDFLKHTARGYVGDRDRPDREGTSGLSPHLRFGEISPRQVWHAARFAAAEHPAMDPAIDKFLSELGWREFCRHLLHDHPNLATDNLQTSFDGFPWKSDKKALPPGSAAAPVIPSSMPACASSGTPA